jgi:hypothetical protein
MSSEALALAAAKDRDAAIELNRISSKLNGISSLFMVEDEGTEITFHGEETFGFGFIIQDLAQEIKVIAERLEGGSDNE